MADWFARPILHVKDVDASLRFYVNMLGFTSPWRYEEEGRARVAQVDRQCCALILANNLAWEKIGKAVIFISLNVESATPHAATAALDALRAELEAKGVPVKEVHGAIGFLWSMISTAISSSSIIRARLRPPRLLEMIVPEFNSLKDKLRRFQRDSPTVYPFMRSPS